MPPITRSQTVSVTRDPNPTIAKFVDEVKQKKRLIIISYYVMVKYLFFFAAYWLFGLFYSQLKPAVTRPMKIRRSKLPRVGLNNVWHFTFLISNAFMQIFFWFYTIAYNILEYRSTTVFWHRRRQWWIHYVSTSKTFVHKPAHYVMLMFALIMVLLSLTSAFDCFHLDCFHYTSWMHSIFKSLQFSYSFNNNFHT